MTAPVETFLPLLLLPAVLLAAGGWLAARLTHLAAAERLAVATLAGLAVLLWNSGVVGFFRPIRRGWAWLGLWPVALGLLDAPTRRTLARDLVAVFFNRRGLLAAALLAASLLLLVWPLLHNPALVVYDGTSSHDAFFWITHADFLKLHPYLEHGAGSPIGSVIFGLPPWHLALPLMPGQLNRIGLTTDHADESSPPAAFLVTSIRVETLHD